MKEEIQIAPIKLSDVEKMVDSIRKNTKEDVDLSFEFILTAFFPNCWNNVQKALSRQYTLGYIEGQKNKDLGEIEEDADCFCD